MQSISKKDTQRLRTLAKQQAEVAASPSMSQLYADWEKHGCFCKQARPMFTIELWTFADEVIPPMLKCEGVRAREIEGMLLSNVIPYTLFGDDTPVRSHIPVPLHRHFIPFGLKTRKHDADNSGYVGVGHRFETYLHNIREDWQVLGEAEYGADLGATQCVIDQYNEIFGDILPAKRCGETAGIAAGEDIIHIIGMEDLYMAVHDAPDMVHRLIERLLEDYGKYFDFLQAQGLFLPTCSDQPLPQGSYCFTNQLPSDGADLTTRQIWGYMDAESFNDLSPSMYKEFIVSHFQKFASRFGALSYGCCEALHDVWDGGVENIPNLKKVSISAWCDQRFMGERLRGREIVFLRKPTANLLGVGRELDEHAVKQYFRETAEAASGCRLEVSQRDVYLLNNTPDKVRRYVQIARESIEHCWKP